MPINFQCDKCTHVIVTGGKNIGSTIKCPGCQDDILVPNPNRLSFSVIQAKEPGAHAAPKDKEAKGIKFKCPECGQPLEADTKMSGHNLSCPNCKKKFIVPSQDNIGLPLPHVKTSELPPVEEVPTFQIKNPDPLPSEELKSSKVNRHKFYKISFFVLLGCVITMLAIFLVNIRHVSTHLGAHWLNKVILLCAGIAGLATMATLIFYILFIKAKIADNKEELMIFKRDAMFSLCTAFVCGVLAFFLPYRTPGLSLTGLSTQEFMQNEKQRGQEQQNQYVDKQQIVKDVFSMSGDELRQKYPQQVNKQQAQNLDKLKNELNIAILQEAIKRNEIENNRIQPSSLPSLFERP